MFGYLCSLRAPLRLSSGDTKKAKDDFLRTVAVAHPDDRHVHSHHFALAAIYGQEGDDVRGRKHYRKVSKAISRIVINWLVGNW